jgi:hypothetical protein
MFLIDSMLFRLKIIMFYDKVCLEMGWLQENILLGCRSYHLAIFHSCIFKKKIITAATRKCLTLCLIFLTTARLASYEKQPLRSSDKT